MSVTIVSVSMKTESGDSYLFLYDQVSSPEEFASMLSEEMMDELEYVCDWDVRVLYGDLDAYEEALRQAINGEFE